MQNESEHFKNAELACECCGKNLMQPEFLAKLEELRTACGFALVITSAYRCPKHNWRVSRTGKEGPHTTGRAVDIAVRGDDAHKLIGEAYAFGFTGIGPMQHGGGRRFVHLDDLTEDDGFPRPWLWSY